MRIAFLTVIAFFILNSTSKAQGWVEQVITIDNRDERNTALLDAGIRAYISDENGEPHRTGTYVMLDNRGDHPLYYRTAPGFPAAYEWVDQIKLITWSPANVLTYFVVPPHQKRLLTAGGYYSKRELALSKNMVAQFKFFKKHGSKGKRHDEESKGGGASVANTPRAFKFYIYLTARLELPSEQNSLFASTQTVYVISEPIAHTGALNDSFINEKELFIKDIDSQVTGKPENLPFLLKKNNYENIKLWYGKPNSTTLLNSETAAFEAIETFKSWMREVNNDIKYIHIKK